MKHLLPQELLQKHCAAEGPGGGTGKRVWVCGGEEERGGGAGGEMPAALMEAPTPRDAEQGGEEGVPPTASGAGGPRQPPRRGLSGVPAGILAEGAGGTPGRADVPAGAGLNGPQSPRAGRGGERGRTRR